MAAINRADVLDPALPRPGRFDRRVNITLPERKDREAILKVHFKKNQLDETVGLDNWRQEPPAHLVDLANMVE